MSGLPVRNEAGQWVIPGTRRPDGTWRKDIIVKEGYVPQDEIKPFETRASRLASEPKKIPGLPCPPPAPAPVQRVKAEKKPSALAESVGATDTSTIAVDTIETVESKQKKLRALKKKLREIVDLADIPKDKLSAEQMSKISKRVQIEEEISRLESDPDCLLLTTLAVSAAVPEAAVMVSDPVPNQANNAESGENIQSALSAEDEELREKKIKALRKKLKQIDDLEAKRNTGGALDADQLKKVAQKNEIRQELNDLVK